LLVDLDPQGAIGLSLAKGDTELAGIAELLTGSLQPKDAVLPTRLDGLSLLPRGRLDATDVDAFEQEVARQDALDQLLAGCEGSMDLVLVDTPSGMGRVTSAALAAADYTLMPFQTESLSLRSVGQALKVIEHVQATRNSRLRLIGILPTLVEREKEDTNGVLSEIWNGFPDALETIVPRTEAFARASALGIPVAFLAGHAGSPEARRFDLLADEVETRMNRIDGMEGVHEAQSARQLL
jgi:chromosome partitioning protein